MGLVWLEGFWIEERLKTGYIKCVCALVLQFVYFASIFSMSNCWYHKTFRQDKGKITGRDSERKICERYD
jgi:hypothetical protein